MPGWLGWAPLNDTNLGPASRRRRRQLKLSLSVVASKAGVSPATLSRFEREDGTTPSLVRTELTELETQFQFPVRKELATALGFDSLEAYTGWCARRE
ncbi:MULTISPECIES: helix-turn-helix domain-containing protein [unclassified Sphingomonas]|uniref:helix-turn-helix domain-containing protein n=1 Tax=unclassified Sphingomonas TaxID=196159 RepID=UPI0009E6F66E